MASSRMMLGFDAGPERFQMRAAAIFRRDRHILIHRGTHEDFWTLPGGRVEMMEPAAVTVAREIVEEMETTASVGALHFLVENFFDLGGRHYHELGFYFEAALTAPFPFAADGEVCFRSRDGNVELEFAWVRSDESTLTARNFKPAPLRPLLGRPPEGLLHLVANEL